MFLNMTIRSRTEVEKIMLERLEDEWPVDHKIPPVLENGKWEIENGQSGVDRIPFKIQYANNEVTISMNEDRH